MRISDWSSDVCSSDLVTLGGGVRDRLFKAADIFDRILHPLLQIGGKRPIGQAEAATHAVENDVGLQQQLICAVAEEGEPARIKHDAVEHVEIGRASCRERVCQYV